MIAPRYAFLIPIALLPTVVAASDPPAAKPNTLTAADKKDGWKLLFDGKSTKGWTPRDSGIQWLVKKGELQTAPEGGKAPLASNTAYDDFVLRLEFWLEEGANSGVFFRAPETGDINQSNAYEVNLFDKHLQWPTGSINGVQRNDGVPDTAGKWNTLEIKAVGVQVTVVLNGEKVVEVTPSKAVELIPGQAGGRQTRGAIALQYADGVKFRSVRIKPIER